MSILVVDDDSTLGFMLSRAFAKEGIGDFRLATTGAEALAALTEAVPRVVLLDMNLPDFTGVEVLQQIRGRWNVPVLMHSHSLRPEEMAAAYGAGANGYVEKQSSFEKLRGLLRTLQDYWVEQNRF